MARRHRTRSKRACFPFLRLPADVQLIVLGDLDLLTLRNMGEAVPGVKELILMRPSIIWHSATTLLGPQLRNLLMTSFGLAYSIKATQVPPQPGISDMKHFLVNNLDTITPVASTSNLLQNNALRALEMLCEIHGEVITLVRDYAQEKYECACECDDPGTVIPPLVLSPIEWHRLTRAFYRLKLFGLLFYHYPVAFGLNLEPTTGDFFATLSTFEMDEMIIAYHFLLQRDQYFPLTYIQKECACLSRTPPHDDQPEAHWRCSQGCAKHLSKIPLDTMRQRFWGKLVELGYSNEEEHWVKPYKCLETPQRLWDHLPETNEESEGWRLWSEVRDSYECGADGEEYKEYFSRLGYCFWDASRLDNWGDVFSQRWFKEERHASGYYPYCDYCRGPCDVTM
ncbi:hypothetical protein IQ06DRAFT_375984 [Phaeosphaeriaceae sp. SRC1lsM3a]|nr:hypothetical protein IQ06DRAFT_375984 [Stagonospora sp. SRC1lsM3a]